MIYSVNSPKVCVARLILIFAILLKTVVKGGGYRGRINKVSKRGVKPISRAVQ